MNNVVESRASDAGFKITELCDYVDMSRQNYYAARRLRQRREIDEAMIVELVKQERRMQPRLGGGSYCTYRSRI